MSDPHKIVLILGNGFDLDLGLKTSYKDFWESEYCPKDYPAPLIKHLNECWPDNKVAVKWYDLENELLNYYKLRLITHDYPDVVPSNLMEYIRNFDPYEYTCRAFTGIDPEMEELVSLEYGKYNKLPMWASIPFQEEFKKSQESRDKHALELIKERLCKYLSHITQVNQESDKVSFQVLAHLDEEAKKGSEVNVYTFNYTHVLLNGSKLDAAKVHYMHGRCADGNIIIGTRDDKDYSPSYDFLQKSFDPSFNPPAIVSNLQEADEVVIFGHSIGENDRQYFKAFFKQQTDFTNKHRKDITIFTKDSDSEHQIKRSLQSMTDGNLSSLFSLNNLQIIKTGELEEDKEKLLDFLVKHGKDELATREFIGRCMHSDS